MAAGAFAFVLVVASVVSAYLAIRATRAERAAREQAAMAQAVSDFLQNDLLGQADVDNQTHMGVQADPDIRVRKVLDRAAANIAGKFVGQPLVEATIRRTIGDAYVALGLFEVGKTQLEQSRALFLRELGDQHRETLNAMARLADLYLKQGDYAKAEGLYTEALEGLRNVAGAEHADTVRVTCGLGAALFFQMKPESESFLVSALELSRRVPGENHHNTIEMLAGMAWLKFYAGKYVQSEGLLAEALEIARRLRGEDNTAVFVLMDELAWVYAAQGEYHRAEELSAKGLEGTRRLRGPEHSETFVSMSMRALVWALMGKSARPRRSRPRHWMASAGPWEMITSSRGGGARSTLALTCQQQGRVGEAEKLLTRLLQDARRVFGDTHLSTVLTMIELAELFLDERHPDNAEALLIQAQKAGASLPDENDPVIADTATALARIRLIQLRPADAEPLRAKPWASASIAIPTIGPATTP